MAAFFVCALHTFIPTPGTAVRRSKSTPIRTTSLPRVGGYFLHSIFSYAEIIISM